MIFTVSPRLTTGLRSAGLASLGGLVALASLVVGSRMPVNAATIESLLVGTSPAVALSADSRGVEAGVRFRTSRPGQILGIRFFKGGLANGGPHLGRLWTSAGHKLAEATFSNEAPSGWQVVTFAAPVTISSNTTYVASYFAPKGRISLTDGGFAAPVTSGSLTASAGAGVSRISKFGGFPSQNAPNSRNQFVDVLFSPEATAITSPTPTQTSSEAMPVGDLPGWRQIFADDFTTNAQLGSFLTVYGTKWEAYPEPWRDTSGNGVYSPGRTLSVSNGALDIYLHTENGVHYVAAPAPKLNGPGPGGVTYGRFSVRFRADAAPGYKTAWLLWPDSERWPDDGEIDFPEGDLNAGINGYMHYASSAGGQDWFEPSPAIPFTQWHIATTEWTPGQVKFLLDGTVVATSRTLVPSNPMHWVLQTETAMSGTAPSDTTSGHVTVDWVTAYAMQ